jgi:hypothetical protein
VDRVRADGAAGQVYRLYQAAFNRTPDLAGLGFWVYARQTDATLAGIAQSFVSSAEFTALYGQAPSHRQLVSTYYRNVLHRDGEQAGIDWWVAQMDNGGDAAGVLLGFADSAENKDSLAAGMQNGFDYIPYNSGGPIIPKRTSYANAKGLNIASQQMPSFPDTAAYNEGATGGVAFADFLQTGQLSLVVFTNRWSHDPKVANPPGAIHFYQYVNGAPVDVTARLLSDTTGCASPRRLLVADFNNDGKPDVFAACHGAEFGDYFSWPGEHPRLLLSQADGTYQNVAAPLNCYCHGATAGDIDGNGTVDILLSDMNAGRDGRASLMALINDGKGNFKVVKADEKQFINQDANYFMGDKPYYNVFLTLELVDFDGDGTLDLLLASGEKTQPTTILKGSGDGLFMKPIKVFPKTADNVQVIDIVFDKVLYEYVTLNIPGGYGSFTVRKYAADLNSYTTLYSKDPASGGEDFVFLMPYANFLVPYDARFKTKIGM